MKNNNLKLDIEKIKQHPVKGDKVKWVSPIAKNLYNVKVSVVKVRKKIAKIVPDYTQNGTMPFSYFWVDFSEIGY